MYTFKELLAKEWETTKQMGDAIEDNGEEETYFYMNDCDSHCPLACELPTPQLLQKLILFKKSYQQGQNTRDTSAINIKTMAKTSCLM